MEKLPLIFFQWFLDIIWNKIDFFVYFVRLIQFYLQVNI